MKRVLLIVFVCFMTVLTHNEVLAQAQTDTTTISVTTSANPFDEQIIINVNQGGKTVTGIKILDAIQKDVTSEISINSVFKAGGVSYTLDFTHMSRGVYFCIIYSDKGILETRRLLYGPHLR